MQAATNFMPTFSACWIEAAVGFCSSQFRRRVQRLFSCALLTYLLPDEPALLKSWFTPPVPPPPRSSDRHSRAFHANPSPRCIHLSGDIIARAHLDEQRQLARQVLHFVYMDLIFAELLQRVSLLLRRLSEGAVDCENKVTIVPETVAVVHSPAFVA